MLKLLRYVFKSLLIPSHLALNFAHNHALNIVHNIVHNIAHNIAYNIAHMPSWWLSF